MQALLFANISSLELTDSLDGGAVAFPTQVAGTALGLKLRLAEKLEGGSIESRRVVHSIKASIGVPDARPERGKIKLKIGGGAESAGVNTTEAFPWNSTGEQVAEVINALSGLGGLHPCAVEYGEGTYRIRFANGAQVAIACVENSLWPVSFVNAEAVEFDEGYTHELRLTQTPVCQTSTYGEIVPQAPFVTEIQEGGVNGEISWNEIQKLTIPAEFRGAFQIKRGYRRTGPIGLPVDIDELAEALKAVADEDGEFVLTEEQDAALIEFAGSMAAAEQDELEVVVFDPPPADLLVSLNTNTAEMGAAMRRADATGEVRLPLDIVIELETEVDDEEYEVVIFRSELVFIKPVGSEAQSVAAELVWNQPPARRRYVPFSPDQIVIGTRSYFQAFGDGVDLAFTFNHNLDTSNLHITVRENVEGGLRIPDDEYDVEYDNDDSITLTFEEAPGVNELVVLISSAASPASFLAHTHPIGEITGLETQLSELGSRLAALEDRAGTTGIVVEGTTSSGPVAEWTLPSIMEIIPMRKELDVSLAGGSIAAIPKASLPRTGGLLPAVHDASVENLTVPLPTAESYENRVFKNATGDPVDLPGSYGGRLVRLKANEHAAMLVEDGRVSWYRVAQAVVGETSWYPTNFDRELFRFPVSSKQLRLKKTLELRVGIEVALLQGNTAAQWVFVIEHGSTTDDTAPQSGGTTCTVNATSNVVTATAHGLSEKTPVKFTTTTTLPGGITAGVTYYLRDVGADAFKIALTPGGAAVDITSTGSGTHTVKAQTGANLAQLNWNPVPILEHRIHLSAVASTHLLGVRLSRKLVASVDSIVATSLIYGAEEGGQSTPASADFFLRGRLIRFDTENAEADPRGLVAIAGLARGLGGEETTDTTLGKAIIS